MELHEAENKLHHLLWLTGGQVRMRSRGWRQANVDGVASFFGWEIVRLASHVVAPHFHGMNPGRQMLHDLPGSFEGSALKS